MISEGSRDTEAWRNNAENSDLCQRNNIYFRYFYLIYFKNQTVILNYNNLQQYYCFTAFFNK